MGAVADNEAGTTSLPAILHCIYDPFCGWCYGAAPLLEAARGVADLEIRLHGGGMMAGGRRQAVTEALRGFVVQHDRRIAQLSGQPFGSAYTEGLLRDTGAVFDSAPPTTAILAAETFGKGLDMLHRIQQAHFIEGQRIAERETLARLAEEIGIDRAAYEKEFARVNGALTEQHMDESRALLDRVGGAGFPTFALERDGKWMLLDHGGFLGRPAEWSAKLRTATEST